ncbi:MAG: VIT1/CCC1 transporter family protein [Acidimicrobiia bacterium]|nr:VIT1/CCC1 transporter family protein [Acidimicrobiia bacterium]
MGPPDRSAEPGETSELGEPAGDAEPDANLPLPPPREHVHRDVQGGVARASVFGASDGLVSNVSLILGVAGANPGPSYVRLAGIAGLVAGAVSMAAGEYISMRAQKELFERELAVERAALARHPEEETAELAQIYRSRGVDADTAQKMATEMMADPDRALEAHARDELGIDPEALGSPVGAAAGSFAAFTVGAIVPLVPWFFAEGSTAVMASLILTALAAAAIGTALGSFTGRPKWYSAGRQVLVAAVAAAITYAIGSLIGVDVA